MKKQLFGLMTILTILNACQKNEVSVSLLEEVTIHATIEDKNATKTIMDESNNILWSENDQIMAFMKSSYGHKYQVKPSFVGKSYADFSMVSSGNGNDLSAGNEWEHNVVYYPYSEDIECLKSGANYELEVNLPSEQVYVPDSFANGSMAMVAVSESNNITFKNVLGAIKLQIKGTQKVKSITLQGKNNEKLSGAATVTAYSDETKPAITMAADALKSVTLNCGNGVQLNESKATEFIVSLPPVLFSKGFTVTVNDSDGHTYAIETDKVNTILRSSLLLMPIIKLGEKPSDEEGGDTDELIIPVSYVNLNFSSLKLYEDDIALLIATVGPKDATDKTVIWSSNNPTVVSVDQAGFVTAKALGEAKVTAASGGKSATCTVTVSAPAVATIDYVDEYGINHGKGVAIGMAVWAPVNCGYHATDYKYGKLYQWGRKYGQGYDASDASVPTLSEGGVSEISGNNKSNANVFYYRYDDWVDPRNDKLWNSGTESSPIKADYDPCPQGWRVPIESELKELINNSSPWTIDENNCTGKWFSGVSFYTANVHQVFLPAAGHRYYNSESAVNRDSRGDYWSSTPEYSYGRAHFLYFDSDEAKMGKLGYRGDGLAVRCVQE